MPYTQEHKTQSRERILASAIALFSRQGYDRVTLDMLMAHAGMTRGAFYNHFDSKQELYSEAMISAALTSPLAEETPEDIDSIGHLHHIVEAYLSQAHLQESDNPCLMAFMVTDVANNEPEVRKTYTHIFKHMSHRMANLLESNGARVPQHALALAALMIGGVAVCRTFSDDKLVDEVLSACRALAVSVINAE